MYATAQKENTKNRGLTRMIDKMKYPVLQTICIANCDVLVTMYKILCFLRPAQEIRYLLGTEVKHSE